MCLLFIVYCLSEAIYCLNQKLKLIPRHILLKQLSNIWRPGLKPGRPGSTSFKPESPGLKKSNGLAIPNINARINVYSVSMVTMAPIQQRFEEFLTT